MTARAYDEREFTPEERAILEEVPALCDRCGASYAAPRDTLCDDCRYDANVEFAKLPGAPGNTR